MLCTEFEDRLTDYLDGALEAQAHQAFAEHAMRCPVCHELLSEVKNMMQACRTAAVPPPSAELEANILTETMPEAAMTCNEFEEHLTDYLDGFLPAPLYHRWERHAARCDRCTELPGQVVRAIGACYTYISEERAVPAGLHERILQATLGTTDAEEVRAPWGARLAAYLRALLDPIVSPQFATVATMLLVAVLVLTNTVSADGSISGMYRASVRLAEQTYTRGAHSAVKGAALSGDFKQIADGITDMMGGDQGDSANEKNTQKPEGATEQKADGKNQ
jgi:anti-sigma factor RsiW